LGLHERYSFVEIVAVSKYAFLKETYDSHIKKLEQVEQESKYWHTQPDFLYPILGIEGLQETVENLFKTIPLDSMKIFIQLLIYYCSGYLKNYSLAFVPKITAHKNAVKWTKVKIKLLDWFDINGNLADPFMDKAFILRKGQCNYCGNHISKNKKTGKHAHYCHKDACDTKSEKASGHAEGCCFRDWTLQKDNLKRKIDECIVSNRSDEAIEVFQSFLNGIFLYHYTNPTFSPNTYWFKGTKIVTQGTFSEEYDDMELSIWGKRL
jgi:hypothetical protein